MNTINEYKFAVCIGILGLLLTALFSTTASAGCPQGESELLPNLRALPATSIAMQDNGEYMKFSATSWNAAEAINAIFELVARTPVLGSSTQQIDQRIYCTDGSFYDTPAGSAAYHEAHSHVHFNDYANYVLEENTGNPQNPRQGTKTSFCIMDTTAVNKQLNGASQSAVFDRCPTQDPDFNTQGMSVGWGDTYGSHLAGQELYIADLPSGMYRLRQIFDPKNRIKEVSDDDNESCVLVEIGDGLNGRYVMDRGLCNPPATPQLFTIQPESAPHGTCLPVTITGDNIVSEMQVVFSGGTGPLPVASSVTFNPEAESTVTNINATVCIQQARGGGKNPKLGVNPVWDVKVSNPQLSVGSAILEYSFTVTGGSGDGGDIGGSEKGRKKCNDGMDNDGDDLIDGADPDCK